MDGVCSRYYGVQFQGKVGVLLINVEKVIFRPKLEQHAPEGTKPATRSWRWVAIDRIEVLDGPRGGGSSLRGIKLKSKSSGGKGVTLKVPQDILSEVLQDMNRRLSEDSIGIEGAVPAGVGLSHKNVPSAGERRKTMSDLQNSSLHNSFPRTPRTTRQTLKKTQVKRQQGGRRASMPSLRQDSIPEQIEVHDWTMDNSQDHGLDASEQSVASEISNKSQEGFLNKVGQKLKKNPLLNKRQDRQNKQANGKKPLIKTGRRKSIGELSKGSQHSNASNNSSATNPKQQRQMLEFMKPPPPRRNITAEMAEMEKKVQEQLERRKAMHQKTVEKRRHMEEAKRRLSERKLSRDGSATNLSTPPQRPKGRVGAATRRRSKRDIVFDSIIREDTDQTSTTEASTPESSPKEAFQDEHTGALWNPNSPDNKFRMMILQHAAGCKLVKGKCPYDPICSDHRKVLEHIETCKDDECQADRCRSTRDFLITMRLMMNDNPAADKTTKDFLVGMGAVAPVPVIDIGGQTNPNEWDAFSTVSDGTWFDHGH